MDTERKAWGKGNPTYRCGHESEPREQNRRRRILSPQKSFNITKKARPTSTSFSNRRDGLCVEKAAHPAKESARRVGESRANPHLKTELGYAYIKEDGEISDSAFESSEIDSQVLADSRLQQAHLADQQQCESADGRDIATLEKYQDSLYLFSVANDDRQVEKRELESQNERLRAENNELNTQFGILDQQKKEAQKGFEVERTKRITAEEENKKLLRSLRINKILADEASKTVKVLQQDLEHKRLCLWGKDITIQDQKTRIEDAQRSNLRHKDIIQEHEALIKQQYITIADGTCAINRLEQAIVDVKSLNEHYVQNIAGLKKALKGLYQELAEDEGSALSGEANDGGFKGNGMKECEKIREKDRDRMALDEEKDEEVYDDGNESAESVSDKDDDDDDYREIDSPGESEEYFCEPISQRVKRSRRS